MRARYHFQPRKNWMNDPNGPVFVNGQLHMFYQYNPFGAAWGNMTWGHAVSKDLVHWRHLPNAIERTPGGPDKDGVFSGCALIHQGRPHILYTGVSPEVLCLAIGDEGAAHFEKHPQNPILTVDNQQFSGWRDPFVWQEDGEYRMVIGSGHRGVGGFAPLYRSDDLIHWEHMGELCAGSADSSGDMWECPNFLRFGDRGALIVSALPQGEVLCMQGRYEGGKLAPGKPFRWDLGDCFYAPNTARDADGRYLQWGWMRERGDAAAREAQGWQGMLTLPREVRMTSEGLNVQPAREMSLLRGEKLFEKKNFSVRSGDNPLKGIESRHCEIDITFEPGASALLLEVLRGGQNACARIEYDGTSDSLQVDLTELSGGEHRVVGGAVAWAGRPNLRIFVDGSAIEIYINGREALTTRAYPTEGCDGLRLYARGGVRVHKLSIYDMKSAYEDDNLPE